MRTPEDFYRTLEVLPFWPALYGALKDSLLTYVVRTYFEHYFVLIFYYNTFTPVSI